MTFPEWTKPSVYGAFVSAVTATILGFTVAGWATLSGTDAPSRDLADACLAGLELDGS